MTVRRVVVFLCIALLSGLAVAQSAGGAYRIPEQAIGAGGGIATGGAYRVAATIGETVVGAQRGGAFALDGGFRPDVPAGAPGDGVFANGFE